MGLRQRGASGAALALLRRAQQAFPGDFWINHDLGMALHDCHPPQYEEAIRFLTVAVALRPDSAGVRLNLGNTLARAGRLDEAIVAYRQAIGLKPDYSMAHLQLGLVLAEKGHLDEAVAACRRASQLKPDYGDAYYNLGTLLDRMGRVDEALAPLRRAIDLMPDHAESHCNLGLALSETRGVYPGSHRPGAWARTGLPTQGLALSVGSVGERMPEEDRARWPAGRRPPG